MKKFIALPRVGALGLVAFFLLTGCDPIPGMDLSKDQKRADMYWLYSKFEANYAPLEYKEKKYNFDFEKLKEKYLNEAVETKNNDEFYLVMQKFVAEFKDAHTTAMLTHPNLPNRAKIAYLGISGKRNGNRFVVTEILPTFDPENSKFPIKVGDEISAIDGKSLVSVVKNELVYLQDLGFEEANLTRHMNRIFTRISTSMPLPTKKFAEIKIFSREYTNAEKQEIQENEERIVKLGEKRVINTTVSVPWIVKDLYEFRKAQAEAKGKPVEKAVALNELKTFDLFKLPGQGGAKSTFIGFLGFDGSLKFPTSFLNEVADQISIRGFLNSFAMPDQIESWTGQIEADEKGKPVLAAGTTKSLLKKVRFVPDERKAKFITPDEAVFPTYVTSVRLPDPRGGKNRRSVKVATMFLNTFSPDGSEDEVMEEFLKTLDDLKFWGVNNLVIDLINNGGGNLGLGLKLAQALSNRKLDMPDLQLKLSQTWLDQFEKLSQDGPDAERALAEEVFLQLKEDLKAGKKISSPISSERLVPFELNPNTNISPRMNIVLLVNEMCASMCDTFAGILQDNKVATVVGTRTMGAGGNVVPHYQAPNSKLILRQTESLIRRTDPDKTYLENVGITPDVQIDVARTVVKKYRPVWQLGVETLSSHK